MANRHFQNITVTGPGLFHIFLFICTGCECFIGIIGLCNHFVCFFFLFFALSLSSCAAIDFIAKHLLVMLLPLLVFCCRSSAVFNAFLSGVPFVSMHKHNHCFLCLILSVLLSFFFLYFFLSSFLYVRFQSYQVESKMVGVFSFTRLFSFLIYSL